MDVFSLRDQVIGSYSSYVKSFLTIKDERLNELVEKELLNGFLWPEPLVQLNPAFELGPSMDTLISQDLLHKECHNIFSIKPDPQTNLGPISFYRHQVEGIKAAREGKNYILTTGTGSGKSLAYIVPIVDYVLRQGSGQGIRAIIVYPMNALANSQLGELQKFLEFGYPKGHPPVTFQRYTGQESEEVRRQIIANPPDILLTNYVMLELLLTRPRERNLVKALGNLRFLVLDELHTYRGRQGADVALLVRRLRNLSGAKNILHVGTSATLQSKGSWQEQQIGIAKMASTLFGSRVEPNFVIGESLRRITQEYDFTQNSTIKALAETIENTQGFESLSKEDFTSHILASWIESNLGIYRDADGRLVRCSPLPLKGRDSLSERLSKLTGKDVVQCQNAIKQMLLTASKLKDHRGYSLFAFKLHQFVSKGESVYASLEPEGKRYLTLQAQTYVPGTNRSKILLPMAFCRECGQEYYVVRRISEKGSPARYVPRELNDTHSSKEEGDAGFLFISESSPWPSDPDDVIDRLPDSWLEGTDGQARIKSARKKHLPKVVSIKPDGEECSGEVRAAWFSAPFRFCMNCGVDYSHYQRSDFGKLATLGSEGRSTATTILTLSAIKQLKKENDLPPQAKKLLTFTDNRQDASLQAGHFNDFVEIGLLRSGLRAAVAKAKEKGLRHDDLAIKVFEALDLPLDQYALNPEVGYLQREETDRTLRDILGYYIYRDLKRGWRITSPNLEQTGLLKIEYLSLSKFCRDHDRWSTFHPVLADATPEEREHISKVLLDYLRRELAIRVGYLDPQEQERIKHNSSQYLIPPWAIDENERMVQASIAFPISRPGGRIPENHVFISPRGGFALFLKRHGTLSSIKKPLKVEDVQQIIQNLLDALCIPGLIQRVENIGKDKLIGYQLNASGFCWLSGEGTEGLNDPIRVPGAPEKGHRTNPFFVSFYQSDNRELTGLEAKEHTAQVPADEREEREKRFREGTLPLLFCSPTMELGVDISQLNVVGLRNVPPTPANYAQRSGRAGRSGQPAFILTYCAAGSPHDQYFFKRPKLMVAGAVSPPRLDLANEDLLKSHIHAIWLYESRLDLKSSLTEILDTDGDTPSMDLRDHVKQALADKNAVARAKKRAKEALQDAIKAFSEMMFGSADKADSWLDQVLNQVPLSFENACVRWKNLYLSALSQQKRQSKIILDASRSQKDRDLAKRLRNEAEKQLDLLRKSDEQFQSDFYSYRYFASEGFIPGYNFPRLPLSAYIPARRLRSENREFLSRPRFLAISEFGPRSIIYHEGARYVINKVILPVDADEKGITNQGVLCSQCGYLHKIEDPPGPDKCTNCGSDLPMPWTNLFRMQNVSTKRRDRINSDEEERLRQGFELKTAIKFPERNGRPVFKTAKLKDDHGQTLATLKYGHAATLWRINLGWKRRKDKAVFGFVLDVERGYWASKEAEESSKASDDPISTNTQRVIPYVEDRKNCILIEPSEEFTTETAASLQAALKKAFQVYFQLEDSELAAEPLPDSEQRKILLFYEASEGGAGVLRRLVEENDCLPKICRTALSICHFDRKTGNDLKKAPGAREECESACYDCLLSYYNQREHRLLDRKLLPKILLKWASAHVDAAPASIGRDEHLDMLLKFAESNLEEKWLRFLVDKGLKLPSDAQVYIKECNVRVDFLYRDEGVAIFIDGPHHENKGQKKNDKIQKECLEDMGYHVIRFKYDADWQEIIDQYPDVFGKGK